MKRYDLEAHSTPFGMWVKADEAEARIRELESERDEAYALATERDDLARRVYAMSHAILDLLLAEQEHGPYSDEFNTAKKAAKRLATEAAEAAAKQEGGEE